MELRCDPRSCNRNLTIANFGPKTIFRASTVFEPMASNVSAVVPYQVSYEDPYVVSSINWFLLPSFRIFSVKVVLQPCQGLS